MRKGFVDRTLAYALSDEGANAQQIEGSRDILDISRPDVLSERDTEAKAILPEGLLRMIANEFLLDDVSLAFLENESLLLVSRERRPGAQGAMLAAAATEIVCRLDSLSAIFRLDRGTFFKQESLQLNQDRLRGVSLVK